jgi:hypothetical protein
MFIHAKMSEDNDREKEGHAKLARWKEERRTRL